MDGHSLRAVDAVRIRDCDNAANDSVGAVDLRWRLATPHAGVRTINIRTPEQPGPEARQTYAASGEVRSSF